MMEISAIQAARAERAYGAAAPMATAAPSATPAVSFEAFIGDAVSNAAAAVQQGERVARAGLRGEARAQEVARGLLTAETALQTVVVGRDKGGQAPTRTLRGHAWG